MTKEISDDEFDRLLDEHFSDDTNIKRSIKLTGTTRTDEEKKQSRERFNDPAFLEEWKIKNQQARNKLEQDEKFCKRRAERNRELAKDVNRNKKIADAVTIKYQDPTYKELRAEITRQTCDTDEWKAAHAEGMKKREENGWYEKRGKAFKPIQTPYGQFESKKAAVAAISQLGIGNAAGKLSTWLKTKPDEYYYIAK
jgi:hypothetical protein